MATFNFTTGSSPLPDIGELSYNGCTFSPLFSTEVSGEAVMDKAGRTVMRMNYTLTADGYVTLPSDSPPSIQNNMTQLRVLLTAQAGALVYTGRGFDLIVNSGPLNRQDVCWGPIPKLLDFQPLGSGQSAKVHWQVVVSTTEPAILEPSAFVPTVLTSNNNIIGPDISGVFESNPKVQLLQFNWDTTLSYGEDGYSSYTCRGTLEIAMTRSTQGDRGVYYTADDVRGIIQNALMFSVDLSRFRVTRREFTVSRDKRTLDWSYTCEETPYMNMPPYCTMAHGSYNVKPAASGPGLCNWLCTLRGTYTVRKDVSMRIAWLVFLDLARVRMSQAENGIVPPLNQGKSDGTSILSGAAGGAVGSGVVGIAGGGSAAQSIGQLLTSSGGGRLISSGGSNKAIPVDFSVDEGLYLDSKTISFSLTWRLVTTLSYILVASGVWKKAESSELDVNGNSQWAMSMRNVQGVTSWLPNVVAAELDVIVDFGGPWSGLGL